jgi:hypothetical protein
MSKDIEIIKKGYKKDRYTNAQKVELGKCMINPSYFIEKYIKIQTTTQGRTPFYLYDYQKMMIESFHNNRNTVCLCARQTGKTSCVAAYLLWKAMFEDDVTILVAANKQVQALEIMDRIRFSYENLEEYNWLRAGVTEYNKGNLGFDNGSRIISRATTNDAGRGLSISLLYLDEFSYVPPNIAEDFWTAMSPTLSTGGSCIITSTPNSDDDQFAQIWHGANNFFDDNGNEIENGIGRNGFFPIKVTWESHPDRDLKWATEYRNKIGEDKFLREFDCVFAGSEETLISGVVLRDLVPEREIFKIDEVRWFQEPTPNHVFGIGWDPAMGDGAGNFAAIQVFDLSTMTQIAEWRSKKSTITQQMETMIKVLHYIHQTLDEDLTQIDEPEIFWSFENNGLGEAALISIEQAGEDSFPGEFVHEPKRSGGGLRKKGLWTTNRGKLAVCSRVKRLIETRKMIIKSKPLISEFKNFVGTGNTYKSRSGLSDDLISALFVVNRIFQIVAEWDPELLDSSDDGMSMDDIIIDPLPIKF